MEIQGNELRIICPPGMEIDKENSTFECIKFKSVIKRWRDTNPKVKGYYILGNMIKSLNLIYSGTLDNDNHDVFATEKQAKSALAMAQISQIMANDERFGGIVTDKEWDCNVSFKYVIERCGNKIIKNIYYNIYHFLAFHTNKQRDLFLKENEDLVKDYLMID